MKNAVNLHFASTNRGPGRVVENLAKGLVENGWTVYANDVPRPDVYQGCLQSCQSIRILGKEALMGPNLFVLPSEWGEYCKRFERYIVPSDWVKELYAEFDEISSSRIEVWPAGIDTETWTKPKNIQKGKVLVYFKSRAEKELISVTTSLRYLGLDFKTLRYGSYEEGDLYSACLECNSCILLTGTESQGIAYMQILSMGLPCYVINKTSFDYFDRYKENPAPATSVPYFDKSCGFIDDQFDENRFMEFISSLDRYDSSRFIRENFTTRSCAKKYIDIIREV